MRRFSFVFCIFFFTVAFSEEFVQNTNPGLIQKRQFPNGNVPNSPGLPPRPPMSPGEQMKFFEHIDDFKPNRPEFWPSVGGMLFFLSTLVILFIIGIIKHIYIKKALSESNPNKKKNKTKKNPDQENLLEEENPPPEEEETLFLDPPTETLKVINPSSLSCVLLNYYVNVPFSWKDQFQKLKNGDFSFPKTPTKKILSNISVYFRPGTLTGIMGPSGSGKTTLLNILSGRTKTGSMEGYRILNDMHFPDYPEIVRKQAGYVLQTDTFYSDLTVEESLVYAAMLRLPSEHTMEQKLARVQQVIREVRLEKVSQTKIGDQFKSGISGGQKRRLSIAMELLRLPSLLLLDEPTSGLDANSAHHLILLLKTLATSHNRTIVTTIHSPRPESFAVFDNILLLGEDGHVVFFGPASSAVDYFKRNGYKSESFTSPGDFIIDVLGLDPDIETIKPDSPPQDSLLDDDDSNIEIKPLSSKSRPMHLSSLWANSDENKTTIKTIKSTYLKNPQGVIPGEESLGFWEETFILFSRKLSRTQFSDLASLFFQVFCVGIVLAFAFQGQGFDDINIFYRPYKAIMFIATVTTYVMIVQYLNLVPMYFSDRDILRREIENESSRISTYILSSIMYETPMAILQVLLLCTLGYWLVDLNSEPQYVLYFGLLLIIGVCAWQSMVCLASFVTNRIGIVYTVCFVFLGLGTLFGGLLILKKNLFPLFLPFFYTSVPALTYRTLLHNDLLCCYMVLYCDDVTTLASKYSELPPFINEMTLACKTDNTLAMNLGSMALQFLDLYNESEFLNMIALFVFLVLGRFIAVGVFKLKTYLQYRMKDNTKEAFLPFVKSFLKKM